MNQFADHKFIMCKYSLPIFIVLNKKWEFQNMCYVNDAVCSMLIFFTHCTVTLQVLTVTDENHKGCISNLVNYCSIVCASQVTDSFTHLYLG